MTVGIGECASLNYVYAVHDNNNAGVLRLDFVVKMGGAAVDKRFNDWRLASFCGLHACGLIIFTHTYKYFMLFCG